MAVAEVQEFRRVGPVNLADGISPMNFWTFMYASFVCIGVFMTINFAQPYILSEHLNIPPDQSGTLSGNLTTITEIISFCLIYPFGIWSDRVGRRMVIMVGLSLIGIAYAIYPFATEPWHLYVGRVFFGAGVAAAAAMTATIVNDYPREDSRGKTVGFSSVFNALGIIGIATVVGRAPFMRVERGVDPIVAGRLAFGFAAVLCFVSVIFFRFGLKGGTTAKPSERLSYKVLVTSGMRAAKNPRIALSYASAFTARSDVLITGLFISLWANVSGQERGISAAEALAAVVIVNIVIQFSGVAWSVVFGFIMDKVNRVTGMAISLAIASVGYSSMILIGSPLDFNLLLAPAFIMLGAGMASAMIASVALIGQEAAPKERGAVIGMNGLFGNIGIIFAATVGGRLFDGWAPWAPFLIIGVAQALLFIAAVIIRVVAPGQDTDSPLDTSHSSGDEDTFGAHAVTVMLASAGDNPSGVVRALRNITGMQPHEARDIVDGAPGKIGGRMSRTEADSIKQALEAAGATILVS